MGYTKILLYFFALLITSQAVVIFRGGYIRPRRIQPSGSDVQDIRGLHDEKSTFETAWFGWDPRGGGGGGGGGGRARGKSYDGPGSGQIVLTHFVSPEKGQIYNFEDGGKLYTMELLESVQDTGQVWTVKYYVGGGKLGRSGVAKWAVIEDELRDPQRASEAFDDYLYVVHDNEWLLSKSLWGKQTGDIPSLATSTSKCKTLFDTARAAATKFQLELFQKSGIIQHDRSSDNFMYDDESFEHCLGFDFGLTSDLEEIEKKAREQYIIDFMQEIFEAAASKRCN